MEKDHVDPSPFKANTRDLPPFEEKGTQVATTAKGTKHLVSASGGIRSLDQ
jgi:hypothetical protein